MKPVNEDTIVHDDKSEKVSDILTGISRQKYNLSLQTKRIEAISAVYILSTTDD